MNQYLTTEQLALRLQCTPKWVYAQVREGDIPHVRVGKLIRFQPDEVAGWLRDRTKKRQNA